MTDETIRGWLPLLADLGLERSPAAERGLIVWSILAVLFALLTLWLATRRGGVLRQRPSDPSNPTSDGGNRGWPFMKRALLNVGQVVAGVLAVYALAQITTPRVTRPAGWHLVSPPHEASVLARQGDIIWAGGKEGLFAVHRRTLALVDIPSLKARDLRGVTGLLAEGEVLWIGCRQGLFSYRNARLGAASPTTGRDLGPVTALFRSRDGALWVGVVGGAWRVEMPAGHWRYFGLAEGLRLPRVDTIHQDQGGNLWFASNDPEAVGLFRCIGPEWKFSDQGHGLASYAVNDLMEDHAGVLWVGTGFGGRGGAARFAAGHWVLQTDIPDISREKIRSLFEDSQQRLWFCSEYNGVAIRSGETWKRITVRDGLPGAEVKHMLEDEEGTVWLATERGLGCLRSMP